MNDDRKAAAGWARQLLNEGTAVVLDTETTGLDTTDEICSIAIIDLTGAVLLDTLVKPSKPIPPAARSIHHISDEMVKDAPTFDHVWPKIADLCAGREIVIYNASYDVSMLISSRASAGGPYLTDIKTWWDRYSPAEQEIRQMKTTCAMEWYAQWVGDYSSYHGNYRFQKLPGGDHSALGDCRATLAVIRRMAGIVDPAEQAPHEATQ